MLTPINTPPPRALQARGYHILETLQGIGVEHQRNLACRTLLAVLLLYQPSPSAPRARREAFTTICAEVQVWLKGEIAEMQRAAKTPPRKGKSRPKVGHA